MAGETSRANGRRSRGPRTPEGKARSSRNAQRDGLATAQAPHLTPDGAALARALADGSRGEDVWTAACRVALAEARLARVRRVRATRLREAVIDAGHRDAIARELAAAGDCLPGLDEVPLAIAPALVMRPLNLQRAGLVPSSLPPQLAGLLAVASSLCRLDRYEREALRERSAAFDELEQATAMSPPGAPAGDSGAAPASGEVQL